MTISYKIHPQQQYVHVIGVGQQAMHEMIDVVDALAEDLEFSPLPDFSTRQATRTPRRQLCGSVA